MRNGSRSSRRISRRMMRSICRAVPVSSEGKIMHPPFDTVARATIVSRDRAATQWPAERGLPCARVRARGQQRYWRVRDAHHPGSCGRRGEVYRQAIRRAERTYAQVRYTTMVAITVCPRGASVPVRVRHDAVSGASTWGTCCPQGTLTGRNTADALRRGKTPCRRRETTHQPSGRVTTYQLESSLSKCRAITMRWISDVPSPISEIFASRIIRSTG